MAKLEPDECPKCGKLMDSDDFEPDPVVGGGPPTATCYCTCLRHCDACGIAYSNRRENPVRIYRRPADNVPHQVEDGLIAALDLAINLKNRADKRKKFASERSEDAVTWTVFRWLQKECALGAVFAAVLGRLEWCTAAEPAVLFWGSPVPTSDPRANCLLKHLFKVSDRLGENPRARSEPDVILDFGPAGLIVVEVKYLSPNDHKPNYSHFDRYLLESDAFANPGAVGTSGHYELARNWRIGCDLAAGRPFALVNLVLTSSLPRKGHNDLSSFTSGLNLATNRQFRQVLWFDFLLAILPQLPTWLISYACEHCLLTPAP